MKWNLGLLMGLATLAACGGSVAPYREEFGDASVEPSGPWWWTDGGATTTPWNDDAGDGFWSIDGGEAGVPTGSTACSGAYPSHYALVQTKAIPVPSQAAVGLAFDGQELWVLSVTVNADSLETAVSRVNVDTAAVDRTFVLDIPGQSSLGANVAGLAWDGEQLWTSISSQFGAAVLRIDPTSGILTRQLAAPAGFIGDGLAFDGADLWLSSAPLDVYKLDPVSGAVLEHFDGRGNLAVRACELWETTSSDPAGFSIVDPSTGATVATAPLGLPQHANPGVSTFVGDQLVVANDMRGVIFYSVTPQP